LDVLQILSDSDIFSPKLKSLKKNIDAKK